MKCKCGHSEHWHLRDYHGETSCLYGIDSYKDDEFCVCVKFEASNNA